MALSDEIRQQMARWGKRGGKIGGKAKTSRKKAAARANGKLGGRPRKKHVDRQNASGK